MRSRDGAGSHPGDDGGNQIQENSLVPRAVILAVATVVLIGVVAGDIVPAVAALVVVGIVAGAVILATACGPMIVEVIVPRGVVLAIPPGGPVGLVVLRPVVLAIPPPALIVQDVHLT